MAIAATVDNRPLAWKRSVAVTETLLMIRPSEAMHEQMITTRG